MVELTDQIRESGDTPWCIGIESGDATGWVVTDWVEDIMLRVHGGEAYDPWVENELPFDSPEVREAIEDYMDPIWFTEGNVFGGTPNILQTGFGDSPNDMFNGNCQLHRQASFVEDFFADDVSVGEDVDFFYLPEIAASEFGEPALIAGDLAVAYTDIRCLDDVELLVLANVSDDDVEVEVPDAARWQDAELVLDNLGGLASSGGVATEAERSDDVVGLAPWEARVLRRSTPAA